MTPSELDRLLQRLEQGTATPEEQARVEAFLAEVEQEAMVGDALRHEAGGVDIADAVLAAVAPGERKVPLAEAVRAEAGTVEMVDDVALFTTDEWISAMLDHELEPHAHVLAARQLMATGAGARMTELAEVGHALREAVPAEAGTVDLWDDVAHAVGVAHPEEIPGWDGALLAEAVRAEAGSVDVADAVVRRVQRSALAPAALADLPRPANSPARRWFAIAALAAAASIAVFVGSEAFRGPDAVAAADLQFASAEEIAITDLSYDANTDVFVFQGSGDNAPLIIWVDDSEEATL